MFQYTTILVYYKDRGGTSPYEYCAYAYPITKVQNISPL